MNPNAIITDILALLIDAERLRNATGEHVVADLQQVRAGLVERLHHLADAIDAGAPLPVPLFGPLTVAQVRAQYAELGAMVWQSLTQEDR